MRIAIHDFGGYPFSAQLARALGSRGHDVTYLFAAGIKQSRARVDPQPGDPPSVGYVGVSVPGAYRRNAGLRRLIQERRYGAALAGAIADARPDVVISANCPLDAQATALRATHDAGAGFVHWLQDVYSMAVRRLIEKRVPLAGRAIGARYERLEKDVLRSSDRVVVIAEEFLPLIRQWGVGADRLAMIPNWTPLDEIESLPKRNAWSEEHGLATSPTFLYAGTLGRKHDPGLLVRLADAVPGASVVVTSEGAGTDRLRRISSAHDNLRLLPMQPPNRLAEMFASADVLLAILEAEASEFSVPSKVLTYLAAGRPIVAAMPAGNPAARAIADAGGGIVVEPRDVEGFVSAARDLMADAERRSTLGIAGRAYAEREFDIEAKTDLFEEVLRSAAHRGHSHHRPRTDTSGATRQP
jgi:glycosyltransferase involved in cell wall biosynthesis